MDKQTLRRKILQQRHVISSDDVLRKSRCIVDHLCEFIQKNSLHTILGYASVKGEPNLQDLHKRLPEIRYALPVVSFGPNRHMDFYIWRAGEPLVANRMGILEPEPIAQTQVTPDESTLMIVPALAATRSGARLGFGGGYYDRYCARFPAALRVGVVFDAFLVDRLPEEEHDVRMAAVCTEKAFTLCPQSPGQN